MTLAAVLVFQLRENIYVSASALRMMEERFACERSVNRIGARLHAYQFHQWFKTVYRRAATSCLADDLQDAFA